MVSQHVRYQATRYHSTIATKTKYPIAVHVNLSRTPVTQNAISYTDSLTDGLLGRPTFWPHVFNRFTRHSRTRPCHIILSIFANSRKYRRHHHRKILIRVIYTSGGHQLQEKGKCSVSHFIASKDKVADLNLGITVAL
jgi:hypothetical protein